MLIELPWPDRRLHPNARLHWSKTTRARKTARTMAAYLARQAEGRRLFIHDGTQPIPVQLTFHPPLPRRRRDQDGMVASIKAYLDGIADGLMVNDACFQFAAPCVLEPIKGGKVVVEITR